MRLGPELRCPLYVFTRSGVKGTRQALLRRQHVARPSLSPLRLGRSRRGEVLSSRNQAPTKQHATNSKPPAAMPAAAEEVERNPQGANPTAFHWQQLDREPE